MGWVWAWEWLRFTFAKQGGHPFRSVISKHSIPLTDVLSPSKRQGSRCDGRVRVSVWEVKLRCSKQLQPFTPVDLTHLQTHLSFFRTCRGFKARHILLTPPSRPLSPTVLNGFHMKENRTLLDSQPFAFVFCQSPQPRSQENWNCTGSMTPT